MSMLYAEWDWNEYVAVQKEEYAEQVLAEERRATAKKALDKGYSPEDIADFMELSIDEVKAILTNNN